MAWRRVRSFVFGASTAERSNRVPPGGRCDGSNHHRGNGPNAVTAAPAAESSPQRGRRPRKFTGTQAAGSRPTRMRSSGSLVRFSIARRGR